MLAFVSLLLNSIPNTWEDFLESSETLPNIIAALYRISVIKEITISPEIRYIMEPFRRVSPEDIRVVIVSSKPSSSKIARGIPFYTKGDFELPAARNIRTACRRDHRGLLYWYEQGVLLIHRSFTTNCKSEYIHRFMEADNEHSAIWVQFVAELLHYLRVLNNPVFIFLGTEEVSLTKYVKMTEGLPHATVITGANPADSEFIYTEVFDKCNEFLDVPIDF